MATKKNKSQRHPDAMKKARQADRRKLRNRSAIARIKTLAKKTETAATPEEKQKALRAAVSAIDKAGRKKVLHHRTASRLVGRLTKRVAK